MDLRNACTYNRNTKMHHDITLTIHPDMLIWPNDPAPVFETIQTIAKDGNQTSLIHLSSHTGTHIDAPKHFVEGARAVDEINPEILIGPAYVAEIPKENEEITAAILKKNIVPDLWNDAKRILFRTKNSHQRLLHQTKFTEDFVGLTPDSADFLIEKGVKLIGVDYLSCENPKSSLWQVHKKLLGAGIVIVEGCDLSSVAIQGMYQLMVLPLKLKGLDGSPCRAILKGF